MGCCNDTVHKKGASSFIICEEEEIIKDFEKQIPFTRTPVEEVVKLFHQFQSKNQINSIETQYVLIQLGFTQEVLTDPDSFSYFFLNSFKNSKNLFSVQKIFTTALLLSPGKTQEKAEALFEIFDNSGIDVLAKDCVSELINTVFDISVLDLPEILLNEIDLENNNEAEVREMIRKHLRKMESRKEYFANKIFDKLMEGGDSITKKKFVAKVLDDSVVGSMIWSYLIRFTLLE